MIEMLGFVNEAKAALQRTTPQELLAGCMALATEKVFEQRLKVPPPKAFIDRYVANGYTTRQAFTVYYEALGAALGVYELPASLIQSMEESWQSFSTPRASNTTSSPAS